MKKIKFINIKLIFILSTIISTLIFYTIQYFIQGKALLIIILSSIIAISIFIIVKIEKKIDFIFVEKVKFGISKMSYKIIKENISSFQYVRLKNLDTNTTEVIMLYIPDDLIDSSGKNKELLANKYKINLENLNIFLRFFVINDEAYELDKIY